MTLRKTLRSLQIQQRKTKTQYALIVRSHTGQEAFLGTVAECRAYLKQRTRYEVYEIGAGIGNICAMRG